MFHVCDCYGEVLAAFTTLEGAMNSTVKGTVFHNYRPGYHKEIGAN